MTFNMFRPDRTKKENCAENLCFIGAKVCAFDRDSMLSGRVATMQCGDVPGLGGLLPADIDGGAGPLPGTPEFIANFGSNSLQLWRFSVDWANSDRSKFVGPVSLAVEDFTVACAKCAPQKKSAVMLETLSDRLMFRLAYRRFDNGEEILTANHSVDVGGRGAVRWYAVHNPGGSSTVVQGTFAPDSLFRWMGSMATDRKGNIFLSYNVSSTSMSPGIRMAGGTIHDTELTAEQLLVTGTGAQASERWGDYGSVTVDPDNDCTFWFTTQYMATGAQWGTKIVSVRFPNC
jgi:hypothetical protein